MNQLYTTFKVNANTQIFCLPSGGLKKLKKESLETVFVTVLTVPRPLCFCFFLIVFKVTFLPFFQSIWQLRKNEKKSCSLEHLHLLPILTEAITVLSNTLNLKYQGYLLFTEKNIIPTGLTDTWSILRKCKWSHKNKAEVSYPVIVQIMGDNTVWSNVLKQTNSCRMFVAMYYIKWLGNEGVSISQYHPCTTVHLLKPALSNSERL